MADMTGAATVAAGDVTGADVTADVAGAGLST
jgi:hypothetical protein